MKLALLQAVSDSGTDWPDALVAMAGITMISAIIVVGVWQAFASWRARVSVAREEAYRKLAEQSAATQQELLEEQKRVASHLTEVRTRVENIERILREVE
jgi:hypothetical protein